MERELLINILHSQYRASLGMFSDVLKRIPEDLWNTNEYSNPNWQIIYHTLWATKFYLAKDSDYHVSFKGAIEGGESLGGTRDWENPTNAVKSGAFAKKEDLISFLNEIITNLHYSIEELPFEDYSGFDWYPYTRFELHINNIRHIQHHTAQMIERLKAKGISGLNWWIDQNEPQSW